MFDRNDRCIVTENRAGGNRDFDSVSATAILTVSLVGLKASFFESSQKTEFLVRITGNPRIESALKNRFFPGIYRGR